MDYDTLIDLVSINVISIIHNQDVAITILSSYLLSRSQRWVINSPNFLLPNARNESIRQRFPPPKFPSIRYIIPCCQLNSILQYSSSTTQNIHVNYTHATSKFLMSQLACMPSLHARIIVKYSMTSIIRISIIRTPGYPNTILNLKSFDLQ